MSTLHKPKCENYDITSIRTSTESRIYWKNLFHRNSLYFGINADFEADNEIDISSIGFKTTNTYQQNPEYNGHKKLSKLEDALRSGCYKSPLAYENFDWFGDEVIKLENKMKFYCKNTKKIS